MIILLQVKNGEKNVILKCQKNEKQTPQIKCLLLPLMFLSWVLTLDLDKRKTHSHSFVQQEKIFRYLHTQL